MRIKTEIKKLEQYELQHRSGMLRFGALVLTAATLFSLADFGHDSAARQAKKDIVTQSPYILNSARENETMRLPVKMDDGLRATATTGR